jgi:hypothetical protein
MVHSTRILVNDISGTGPFVSVQHPNLEHRKLWYRQMASKDFQGVCLDDLMVLEQLFSLNVYVYDLQEMEEGDIAARLVRRSPYS